ncbi:arabinofuranosidase catalytic domain-containing protein [Aestuariivirga sp.]|uniref:arabinofuranosidase catalytic domain-containing protein n=1 Tax=Aestuariivirga sp. TaxID=2650926 RepID=UPI003BABF0F0
MSRRPPVSQFMWLIALLCLLSSPAAAAALIFTVATSEPVVVTGTPRVAIDVGGVTSYATYVSGSGSTGLTFGYQVQPGDFDMNGIVLVSPLQLDGGTITDIAGNPVSPLSFTVPGTADLKIQTYTAAFATDPVTNANANAISISIAKAPIGASFTYAISSSGGSGSVTGAGTITARPHTVSGVDVSNLPMGTLTLSVTVSNPAGGTGTAKTATATPAFTGILDGRAVPEIAVSLHRLRSAYAGPLIRVRRSSDNAEQNIGAGTVAGGLDTAALTAFCGSSSCYIRSWYDQSGNGRDAAQASAAWQPRIVNAGTVERFNGLPAPVFKNSALVTSSLLPSSSAVWSTHLTKVVGPGQTGRGRIWGEDVNPSLATNTDGWDDYFGPSGSAIISSYSTANPRIVSLAIAATGAASIWANGSLASSVSSGVLFEGGQALAIGNLGGLNRAYDGYLHTVILGTGTYPTQDRTAIERWLGTIAGISVP